MGVTIKEIAEAAGVSRGTVDRALNDRPGIKPEIAEHVKNVARQLGYRPNLAAKMLSSQRYGTVKIGVILTTENNAFFDEILLGIQDAVHEFSNFGVTHMIRMLPRYDADAQYRIMQEMEEAGCAGIVMTPVYSERIAGKINELSEKGIKVVTINSDITDTRRIAYVGCHHQKSGEVLADLLGLIADGRPMRIGVIGGTDKNLAVYRRTQSFVDLIQREFARIQVLEQDKNEDSDALSYGITRRMLEHHPQLDAVCIMGGGIVGGIRAIREAKPQRPNLKLFVYDSIAEVKQALRENIVSATITQEPYRQGYDGVQILVKCLAYNQMPEQELNYTELAIVTKNCI